MSDRGAPQLSSNSYPDNVNYTTRDCFIDLRHQCLIILSLIEKQSEQIFQSSLSLNQIIEVEINEVLKFSIWIQEQRLSKVTGCKDDHPGLQKLQSVLCQV